MRSKEYTKVIYCARHYKIAEAAYGLLPIVHNRRPTFVSPEHIDNIKGTRNALVLLVDGCIPDEVRYLHPSNTIIHIYLP
jgi:hypothetical protein